MEDQSQQGPETTQSYKDDYRAQLSALIAGASPEELEAVRLESKRTIDLVRAALGLFLSHGLEAVTIDDITRQAGVAKGSFYRYFEDKAALVRVLFEEVAGVRRHERRRRRAEEQLAESETNLARVEDILGELRPEPLATVTNEDPGLGGDPVEMWSYPVIKDGLIYVIDVRNGLYILRYRGHHEEQVTEETFLEGNSNL